MSQQHFDNLIMTPSACNAERRLGVTTICSSFVHVNTVVSQKHLDNISMTIEACNVEWSVTTTI